MTEVMGVEHGPLRECSKCHAGFLDDEGGRAAHVRVFGHRPVVSD